MFEVVSKLLMTRQLKFQEGRINIVSLPVVMGPVEPLVLIQESLEKEGMQKIIYYSNKKIGYKWFSDMDRVYHLKDLDVFKWGNNLITLGGWGVSKLVDFQPKQKHALFSLENSSIAANYNGSEKFIDHYYRGLLAGACSFVMGEDVEAVESKCVVNGDKHCQFVIKPRNEFDCKNLKVQKQID